jgi:heme/copper-type cytochrome/quinol oxidase subunit 2
MNRKQRACIAAGFLVVLLMILFPPWKYGRSASSYGFLFAREAYGELDLTRLLVELLLVVFVTGGMLLMLRESTTESNADTPMAAPTRTRFLLTLTMILVILVLSLGGVSYTAVRRLKRLEVGIQNVRGLIGQQPQWVATAPLTDQLPPSHPVGQLRPLNPQAQDIPKAPVGKLTPISPQVGGIPTAPVGKLRPLNDPHVLAEELSKQWQQAELKRKTEQLRAIGEELDKLH